MPDVYTACHILLQRPVYPWKGRKEMKLGIVGTGTIVEEVLPVLQQVKGFPAMEFVEQSAVKQKQKIKRTVSDAACCK